MLKLILICSLIASCGDACREVKKTKTVRYEDPAPAVKKCRIFYYMRSDHLKDIAIEACDEPRPEYVRVYTIVKGDILRHTNNFDVDINLARDALDNEGVNLLYVFHSLDVW